MMGWTPPDGIYVPVCGLLELHTKEASVEEVSIIGLDLAKRIFQAHGADRSGKCLFSRKHCCDGGVFVGALLGS